MGNGRSYNLRVDLEDWDNEWAHAEYSAFTVDNAANKYLMDYAAFIRGSNAFYLFARQFFNMLKSQIVVFQIE